ncbi:MAG: cytidylate kinase-like family protein [Ruminococcaceae bacterium]|nr:cytidylate kinase-like family protein [Oscillospiraceae bacterium]
MKKVIVTIGREFGSGGREIGLKLSEKLGIPFYDKELILHTAEKTNLEESIIEKYDEQHSFPAFSSSNIFDIYQMPMSDRIYIAQADVIRDIAAKESCIIVGRCADFILDENPDVFKVFITAPMKDKVERKRHILEGKKDSEIENHIAKIDKKRAKYYTYYTDRTWGKASTYNLCIDSSILGIDGTVELIAKAIEMR